MMATCANFIIDGTCMSTLEPQCIQGFRQNHRDDILIFIKRVISIYQTLPTYTFLKRKGCVLLCSTIVDSIVTDEVFGRIVPSATRTYKFADILSALKAATVRDHL